MLETLIDNGYLYTMDLHLRYVYKTLFEYSEHSLPHMTIKKLIEQQIYWIKELNELGEDHGIGWTTQNIDPSLWIENKYNLQKAQKAKQIGI